MKNKNIISTLFILLLSITSIAQGVKISIESGAPDESAILEISSTERGVLFPRMTTLERDAILNPAESLMIFNTDTKCFETYVYDVWQQFWCADAPCYPSNPASSITGTTDICSGGNTNLSVSGGSLGTGADWVWYESACGGTPIDYGSTINVSPLANTTYYVRAEGDCDTTTCVNITVNIVSTPSAPTADAATDIGDEYFTANWQTSATATSYFIQVADINDFSNIIFSGDVGNVTEYDLSSLLCETDYYYRVSAVNTCGNSTYSNTISVTTDVCGCSPAPCAGTPTVSYWGETYNTVQIGGQCWMVENLRTTQYRNGTSITQAELTAEWSAAGTDGRYCTAGSGGDGYFYNNYAAINANNICPTGWRVATQSDFTTLTGYVPDGASIKDDINWNGTNSCGWTGRAGGYRAGSGTYYDAQHGFWWTTTNAGGGYYVDFRLYDNDSFQINTFGSDVKRGQYVRCIKE